MMSSELKSKLLDKMETPHVHIPFNLQRKTGNKKKFVDITQRGSFRVIDPEQTSPIPFGRIDPDSLYKQIWDMILMIIIIWSIIVVPYRLAFKVETLGGWKTLGTLNDVFFFLDICVNFFTGFPDRQTGEKIYGFKEIACTYLSGWFLIDFLSTVPFSSVYKLFAGSGGDKAAALGSMKLLRTLRLLKLFRMFRVFKMEQLFEKGAEMFNIDGRYITITSLLLGQLFSAHLIACIWYGISAPGDATCTDDITVNCNSASPVERDAMCGDLGPCVLPDREATWVYNKNIDPFSNVSSVDRYTVSLYFAYATMTTVGYGDVSAVNNMERVVSIFLMVLGVTVYGYNLFMVCNLAGSGARVVARQSKLDKYDNLLIEKETPKELRRRVMQLVRINLELNEDMMEEPLFQFLSPKFLSTLTSAMFRHWPSRIPFFQQFQEPLRVELYRSLHQIMLNPGETLFHQGEVAIQFYVLFKGSMMVMVERPTRFVVDMLEDDGLLGIAGIVHSKPHVVTAQSINLAYVTYIAKECLMSASIKFPELWLQLVRESTHSMQFVHEAKAEAQQKLAMASSTAKALAVGLGTDVSSRDGPPKLSIAPPQEPEEPEEPMLLEPIGRTSPVGRTIPSAPALMQASNKVHPMLKEFTAEDNVTSSGSSEDLVDTPSDESRAGIALEDSERITVTKKTKKKFPIRRVLAATKVIGRFGALKAPVRKKKSAQALLAMKELSRTITAIGPSKHQNFDVSALSLSSMVGKTKDFYIDEKKQLLVILDPTMDKSKLFWKILREKYLVFPTANIKAYFDIGVASAIIYSVVIVPPMLVGLLQEDLIGFKIIAIIVDIIFWVDMAVQFNTLHLNGSGSYELGRKVIAKNYLKGWFLLDFMSTFPFAEVMGNSEGRGLKLLRVLRLARLLKLARVLKLSSLVGERFTELGATRMLLGVAKQGVIVAFCLHMLCCIWYYNGNAQFESGEPSWVGWYCPGTDDNPECIRDTTEFSQTRYISSLYWAFATCMGVGYGDVYATTPPLSEAVASNEVIIAIVGMSVGAIMFSLFISAVLTYVQERLLMEVGKDERLRVNSYFEDRRLPRKVRMDIKEKHHKYVELETPQFNLAELLTHLPAFLQIDLVRRWHGTVLTTNTIFTYMEERHPGFFVLLNHASQWFVYDEDDMLLTEGESLSMLYFLMSGSLEVTDKDNCVLEVISPGEKAYFGEAIFAISSKDRLCYDVSVRAMEHAEVISIEAHQIAALADYDREMCTDLISLLDIKRREKWSHTVKAPKVPNVLIPWVQQSHVEPDHRGPMMQQQGQGRESEI